MHSIMWDFIPTVNIIPKYFYFTKVPVINYTIMCNGDVLDTSVTVSMTIPLYS